MLEQLLIFTRGGLILWTCKELGNALKGSPIDTLIRTCLLENVRVLHCTTMMPSLGRRPRPGLKKSKQANLPTNNNISKKQGQVQKSVFQGGNKKNSSGESGNDNGDGEHLKVRKKENGHANGNHLATDESSDVGVVNGKENVSSNTGAFDVNKLQKLRAKGGKKTDTVVNKITKAEPQKKITKKNRVWDDSPSEPKLDFTDPVSENGDENIAVVAAVKGERMMDRDEIVSSDSGTEEEEEAEKDGKVEAKKKGWFSSMFQSIAGKANLEKVDLEPALKALKDRLMTKNLAEEIAEKLYESVAASLEGKKLASFTRISSTVQDAMEDALIRILTPRRSIDILRDVHAAKEQRKPYVVVFVGVNGVGKSTNLAKVAYWLQQHKVNVMMAACDTFRSGAVEQLRTHARRLQISIFEKGYEKDPAIVAKEAIQEATRNGSDVVLVDTAGRMQKLADLSSSPTPQLIDGILLTKFDTIDDKSYIDLKKLNVKSIVKTLLK
ncbi:signal recognition particle receptor alpha subunit family protein [Actinidia rufa]|uniref:Signal recognition particle receptor alpha subunit family protein n=1 Tax=Actinidia rufa TaxID=165716 RepID=A0A7J0EGW0_9ERIC|nr:signal recognition particle receptor alpha subunit family protein [Actinidia rufa]